MPVAARMTPARHARLVPLADIVARGPEDQEPAPGFVASLNGEDFEVTAVLERTAVLASLHDRWADKRTARLSDLLVDPEAVRWRPKTLLTGFPDKRPRRYSPEQRAALRAASDRRARADQARRPLLGWPTVALRRRDVPLGHRDRLPARPHRRAHRRAATSRSAIAVSAISADRTVRMSVDLEVEQPAQSLTAELRRARQRIAALEFELERHRTVVRDVLWRIARVIGPRAA